MSKKLFNFKDEINDELKTLVLQIESGLWYGWYKEKFVDFLDTFIRWNCEYTHFKEGQREEIIKKTYSFEPDPDNLFQVSLKKYLYREYRKRLTDMENPIYEMSGNLQYWMEESLGDILDYDTNIVQEYLHTELVPNYYDLNTPEGRKLLKDDVKYLGDIQPEDSEYNDISIFENVRRFLEYDVIPYMSDDDSESSEEENE